MQRKIWLRFGLVLIGLLGSALHAQDSGQWSAYSADGHATVYLADSSGHVLRESGKRVNARELLAGKRPHQDLPPTARQRRPAHRGRRSALPGKSKWSNLRLRYRVIRRISV